jgi:purine nucleosidase
VRFPGRLARRAILILLSVAAALTVTLALPVPQWRTGQEEVEALSLAPAGAHPITGRRIWVDTDAACGGRRTDPDDCLALLALLKAPGLEVVGISTVFGNAPLDVTDRTTRELASRLADEGFAVPPVWRGRDSAGMPGTEEPSPAERSMADALSASPMVIVALGPLTNIAALLHARPDLAPRIERVIAVMGQRPGHVFHPVEGGTAAILLGHGPVFRDLNFASDPASVEELLNLDVPMTLIPYEAARKVTVMERDLDALHRKGGAARWVAERSREWLAFWREDIRQEGFFPFDLVAATYLLRPDLFRCAETWGWIGHHPWFWRWHLGKTGLFVTQEPHGAGDGLKHRVVYCPQPGAGLHDPALAAVTRVKPSGIPLRDGG